MELIRNWCAHARVEKFGGTGFIEMETGLPIGHHSMACDYAPAGGIATWDLAEAALDFHDRNCINCTHRAAVRLPNLTSLLNQRDSVRNRAAADRQARETKAVAERVERQHARALLRTQLDPLSATIVDHLEELDRDSPEDAAAKLLGAATLAPETFAPVLIEHCFALLEAREHWFDEAGLAVLDHLPVDRRRLTRCAMRSLREHWSVGTAARIVEANSTVIDDALVADALPALVGLANPERSFMAGGESELAPGPLLAVHRARGPQTEAAIANLLDHRDPYLISCGARAILVLAEQDKAAAGHFTRSMAAKLAGAKWLIDSRETGFSGEDPVIHELQDALVLAFEHSPEDTDALLAQFMAGAPSEGEVRLYGVYERVLRGRGRYGSTQSSPKPAARVALSRILGAVTLATNEKVLRELLSAVSHVGEELLTLAREHLTSILGAAVLIDGQLQRFDAEPELRTDLLARLERRNRRFVWESLQKRLVEWAAAAACGDESATDQYIEVLGGIPEARDELRSIFIEHFCEIMRAPDGLNAVLPALYTAMVGASSRLRAAAASAIGDLRRSDADDLPDLLYEAFVVLLLDPYRIVHYAAVEALGKVTLPKQLDRRERRAISALIDTYAVSREDDRFLLQCIELYLDRYATDAQKRGDAGRFFVALLDRMKPDVVVEKLRWLRRHLKDVEGFADIVLRVLADGSVTSYRQEDILKTLNELPVEMIQARKSRLETIAIAPDAAGDLPSNLVETLTHADAWAEAARISGAIHARIPDTTQMHVRKLMANFDRIAAKYEQTIALGELDALPVLAAEWRATEAEIAADRIQYAERRRPFSSFPGPN